MRDIRLMIRVYIFNAETETSLQRWDWDITRALKIAAEARAKYEMYWFICMYIVMHIHYWFHIHHHAYESSTLRILTDRQTETITHNITWALRIATEGHALHFDKMWFTQRHLSCKNITRVCCICMYSCIPVEFSKIAKNRKGRAAYILVRIYLCLHENIFTNTYCIGINTYTDKNLCR